MGFKMKLSVITDKVSQREWVLPTFQREYVWNDEPRIREFLESIFYDWPVGSIILWTPNPKDKDIIKKRKLQTEIKGSPEYLQEYIIDGQQRITTLLRAFKDETFVFRGIEKRACYDFSSKKFVFMEKNPLATNIVSLKDIIDLSHSKIKEKMKLEELNYDVDDLIGEIKRMEKYDMNIQRTPERTSMKDAMELFIRLNTGGKPLPSVDLALAYISLLWDESREEFKKFRDSLKPTGFCFDLDFFIRCLFAVSLKQSIRKTLIRSFSTKNVQEDWDKTRKGIEKTIDFLKTTLNLGSNLFLEAENSLVPIVFLFSEKEETIKGKMNLLAYWFIVSYLNQRFSGQSTTVLNRDINTIQNDKKPIEGLINNLKEDRSIFVTKADHIKGGQFKFILYTLYKDIRTTDFVTGFGIDTSMITSSNRLDLHHIFADSLLKKTKFKSKKEEIANKTFLTNKSNKILSNSEPTYLAQYDKNLLQAHFIPKKENLWKLNNYDDFLNERGMLISSALNDFLTKLKGNHVL